MKRETKEWLKDVAWRSGRVGVEGSWARDAIDSEARQTAELRALRKAVRVFPEAYPDREWEMRLHEEGCPGSRLLPEERAEPDEETGDEGEVCHCDGDNLANIIKAAVRPARKR